MLWEKCATFRETVARLTTIEETVINDRLAKICIATIRNELTIFEMIQHKRIPNFYDGFLNCIRPN